MLTPRRRRGIEILDDPSHDPALAVRSLRDVAKANLLFGGRHAVVREARRVLRRRPPRERRLTVVDIGTGLGDIPRAVARAAARQGLVARTIGVELEPALAAAALRSCSHAVVADAMRLPFADAGVDIVTLSQVLHHFDGDAAEALLRECTRVARDAVIVADLRRSWFAIGGLWLSSFLLGFHPVSRNDGVVSILRGYTVPELHALVRRAIGRDATVRRAPGSRVTAVWPGTASLP